LEFGKVGRWFREVIFTSKKENFNMDCRLARIRSASRGPIWWWVLRSVADVKRLEKAKEEVYSDRYQGRGRWGRNVHSGRYPGGEDVCTTVARIGQVRLHLGLLSFPLDGSLFRQIHWMDDMNETCPVGLLADRFGQHPENGGS